MNQTEFRLVHNQKENCHYDHIPLNLRVTTNLFPRVGQWMHWNHQFAAVNGLPGCSNLNDQASRGCRLLASCGTNWGPLWNHWKIAALWYWWGFKVGPPLGLHHAQISPVSRTADGFISSPKAARRGNVLGTQFLDTLRNYFVNLLLNATTL